MIGLEAMTSQEFEESLRSAIARRADDQVQHRIWSNAVASETSRREYAQLLPEGRDTPHFHFCKVIVAETGQRVGETWYSVEEKGGRIQFWLHWLWIDPSHRRRGYATQVFALLEQVARMKGADRVGLSVAADNRDALALYAKLGLQTTNMRMAKWLFGPP
ncbi:MAG: GNAT family N-acetyltransferase [Thermoplasmata archaeon]|nr:GNAT family N-acetyltransferase [Thermoplasmata archaeon]